MCSHPALVAEQALSGKVPAMFGRISFYQINFRFLLISRPENNKQNHLTNCDDEIAENEPAQFRFFFLFCFSSNKQIRRRLTMCQKNGKLVLITCIIPATSKRDIDDATMTMENFSDNSMCTHILQLSCRIN